MNYYERERVQSRILAAANIVAPFAAQKSTRLPASRHRFDKRADRVHGSKQAALFKFQPPVAKELVMQKACGLNRRRSCGARAATLMPSMRITSIVALVLLLASCASSGLYNMSDNWCAAHLNASAARCLPDPQRVADKELERVANNSKQQPGPN
jgi:hypothetical protein